MIFLYSQRRPSCRRHTRPRTRRPEMDSLGIITVQRCQNSAPAGFILRVSGGSIAVNMVLSSSQYRNNGLIQSGPGRGEGDPTSSRAGTVRQLHAICSEVESNPIHLLRLMPGQMVKSGTANIQSRVSRALTLLSTVQLRAVTTTTSPCVGIHRQAAHRKHKSGASGGTGGALLLLDRPSRRMEFFWCSPCNCLIA